MIMFHTHSMRNVSELFTVNNVKFYDVSDALSRYVDRSMFYYCSDLCVQLSFSFK